MKAHQQRTDLPVLLLYNIDPEWPSIDIEASVQAADLLVHALQELGHPMVVVRLEDQDLRAALRPYSPSDHLVFNWCEEIPRIPRSASRVTDVLESLGFTYTGADPRGLRLAQNKRRVKQRLDALAIPTPRWRVFRNDNIGRWDIFPAIVKPVYEHCSFGVDRDAVVQTREELAARVRYVLETFAQPALVEEFIDGREIHVGVVGNGHLQVLPPAEMDFAAFGDVHDRLCTFDSKFTPGSDPYDLIQIRLPAALSPAEREQIERVTLNAYRATECRDYARLDLRMRDGVVYVLDINHNADFSPDTSLTLSAELAGISYGQLASSLVNLAAQRHPVFGH